VSTVIRDLGLDYWTGTVYTTNRRVWEHDGEFKDYLRRTRAMAIDMETATIFAAGFANRIPTGALMLQRNTWTPDADGVVRQLKPGLTCREREPTSPASMP
jgi:uridine phosphorylase